MWRNSCTINQGRFPPDEFWELARRLPAAFFSAVRSTGDLNVGNGGVACFESEIHRSLEDVQ